MSVDRGARAVVEYRELSELVGVPIMAMEAPPEVLATAILRGGAGLAWLNAVALGTGWQGFALTWIARELAAGRPGFRFYLTSDVTLAEQLGMR